MKKLFNINSILVMCLCMITSLASAGIDPASPAPEKDNILSIKGVILNDVKATITTFYWDDIDCAWFKYEKLITKNSYSVMLNPVTDYQIWYQDEAGHIKVVYIAKGESGVWMTKVNINFEAETDLYAYMYQVKPVESFHNEYYALEGIGLSRSEEIVNCMENPCIDAILYSNQ